MALHRRFRPVFKKYAPRGTARFAKPLQGPFSLVAKHPQKHKNRPEIGRFSHFNPGAEMHLFSLFSASKSPEKWLYDAICRKKQLFAGSFSSRSHSSCSFTAIASFETDSPRSRRRKIGWIRRNSSNVSLRGEDIWHEGICDWALLTKMKLFFAHAQNQRGVR